MVERALASDAQTLVHVVRRRLRPGGQAGRDLQRETRLQRLDVDDAADQRIVATVVHGSIPLAFRAAAKAWTAREQWV